MTSRLLALALLLAACGGPATPPPRAPSPEPAREAPRSEPAPDDAASLEPSLGPCAASPPSHDSLVRPLQPGLLVVDAGAPGELGACISPQLALREGAVSCDPSGLRCRVGERHVLLARERDGACVPIALVRYPSAPPDADSAPVEAALSMRDEACALHDRVVRADPALYAEVARARRIAPAGRRAELGWQCLTGEEASALADEVRARFQYVPLRCAGLRCESEHGDDGAGQVQDEPRSAPPLAGSLVFAHRLAGPLRFDGVAWLRSPAEIPRALELLRRRCR